MQRYTPYSQEDIDRAWKLFEAHRDWEVVACVMGRPSWQSLKNTCHRARAGKWRPRYVECAKHRRRLVAEFDDGNGATIPELARKYGTTPENIRGRLEYEGVDVVGRSRRKRA